MYNESGSLEVERVALLDLKVFAGRRMPLAEELAQPGVEALALLGLGRRSRCLARRRLRAYSVLGREQLPPEKEPH